MLTIRRSHPITDSIGFYLPVRWSRCSRCRGPKLNINSKHFVDSSNHCWILWDVLISIKSNHDLLIFCCQQQSFLNFVRFSHINQIQSRFTGLSGYRFILLQSRNRIKSIRMWRERELSFFSSSIFSPHHRFRAPMWKKLQNKNLISVITRQIN